MWKGEYPRQVALPGILPGSVSLRERRWLGFDRGGALVASVRTPPRLDPHLVCDDRVWGVSRDELDVQTVRDFQLLAV